MCWPSTADTITCPGNAGVPGTGSNWARPILFWLCFAMLYGQIQASADQAPGELGEPAMAKYLTLFTYTSETWARMVQSPSDRTATGQKDPKG